VPPVIWRKLIVLAVLATLLFASGCGSDDGGGPDDKGGASAEGTDLDRLLVSKAYADIDTFCVRAKLKSTRRDLQNVGFIQAVEGVNRLVAQRRKDPDIGVPLNTQRNDVPFEQVYREVTAKLKRGCGKDGKLAAQRLERAASG